MGGNLLCNERTDWWKPMSREFMISVVYRTTFVVRRGRWVYGTLFPICHWGTYPCYCHLSSKVINRKVNIILNSITSWLCIYIYNYYITMVPVCFMMWRTSCRGSILSALIEHKCYSCLPIVKGGLMITSYPIGPQVFAVGDYNTPPGI